MSLREIIQAQLPLSVHDYMQLCLQHPEYGYYQKAPVLGAEGDFITAPEISQIFGDMLGLWLRDIWQQMGQVNAALVELGPGRGTLSSDVLRHFPASQLHLMESNKTLRESQRELLGKHAPQWHDAIESLPDDVPLFIIANEFFDALPIRQWVGEQERTVSADWQFEPVGEVTREACPAAIEILQSLCARLTAQGGVLWLADYGYLESSGDTLQAVKQHAYIDPLTECGEADLTSHIDFGALKQVAEEAGCHAYGAVTQEKFLRSLGGEIWLQKLLHKTVDSAAQKTLQEGWLRLVSPAQMGELFKVMAINPNTSLQIGGF